MKYINNFKKIMYGYVEVEAENEVEAQKKLENGEDDEFDNKSNYEFKGWKLK